MLIKRLDIHNLRIIRQLSLEPGKQLNFLVGGNGAGKTSILEAIYLAGRGRTFRHATAGPMIRRDSDSTDVIVRLYEQPDSEDSRVLGLRRSKSTFACRLDGEDVRKRSTLAETLPVQWISSQPQQLLEGGPDLRRRFFDMGLFHVEHRYLASYSELSRILKQRNAAIKAGDVSAVTAWNAPFAEASTLLDSRRRQFIDQLVPRTVSLLKTWDVGYELDYRYRKGWLADSDLESELARKLETDMKMGFTSVGPQRAEIELLANGQVAEKTLSRGQQKMLVIAFNIAFIDLVREKKTTSPVFLIDDLNAELDNRNLARVHSALIDRGVQVFIASISEPEKGQILGNTEVFHVEQGAIVP